MDDERQTVEVAEDEETTRSVTWIAPRHKRQGTGRSRWWLRELAFIGAVVLLLFSARWSVADHYRIPTGSMSPTVHVGDRVFVSKASYDLRVPFTDLTLLEFAGPQQADVVVLDSPDDGQLLLKRVVATPGDMVAVREGRLIINGEVVPVEYTRDGLIERLDGRSHPVQLTGRGGPDYGPVEIPEREYLVMGDNRGNSRDGRIFGLVSRELIRGRAVGVYYRGGLSWHNL